MSEQINVLDRGSPAAVIIMNAISTFVRDQEFSEKFGCKGPIQEVKLLVNGHEVPVAETLAEVYRQLKADQEKEARLMAVRMVTEAGLEPLAKVLRDAERKIREELQIWDDL